MGEAALKLKALSAEDYLRDEVTRTLKHEYVDGQVYALAGAGDRHNRVAGNIYFRLRQALGTGPCRAYISDMKLRVRNEFTHRFYYPDVMVTCRPDDAHNFYKVAPSLLVEVMSPSTASVDRREKLLAYQLISELRDYLIVSADERYLERYRRDDTEGWWYHEYRDDGTVKLPYLKLNLTLDDIYEGLF
jgi:Uma2 family endonuclease